MTSHENQFSFGTRLGIFISVEAAALSALVVTIVLCYTGNKLIKKYRAHQLAIKKLNATIELPPIDATDSWGFVGLMFAELILALGGLLNIKWVSDGFITEGSLCEAQGHLKQIGDVGVALMSLYIAFDTFFMFVLRWRASRKINLAALFGVVLFILLMVAISSAVHHGANPPYYGNTTYWCWISPEYKTERIVFEYLWMWIAAFVMLTLYGIIALDMRGIIDVEGYVKTHLRRGNKDSNKVEAGSDEDEADDDQSDAKEIATLLLFYPAVYILCVLPVSIVRWLDFSGHEVPPAALICSSVIFSLSGFFNVLLFKFTRPDLVSGRNLDPPSTTDLPIVISDIPKSPGHSHYYSEVNGASTNRRRTTGLGLLPEDNKSSTSPLNHSPIERETSAARYARVASDASNQNEKYKQLMTRPSTVSIPRPGTQESLRPVSRDSALSSTRHHASESSSSARGTGLGRLPE